MQRFRKASCGALLSIMMLAFSIPCPAQADETPDVGQALDRIFHDLDKPDVPGCSVGVRRADSQPVVRGYGSADLEHDVAISPSTVFEAGSVSKQFTAASILLLAEEGKLSLTDDVHKYIPELPNYGTPISINELLSHTSGLRDWGEVEALAGWPRTSRVYTLVDVLNISARQKSLNYRPGAAYSYTNTGYNLLAIIIERVSGKTLAHFSQDRLFEPLRMTHTQWRDDFRRVVKGRAIAYEAAQDGYRQRMPFEDAYGNGGLLTTVGDLLRWNDALTAGELGNFVSTEIQRQGTLETGRSIAYARGLFVESYQGVREIAHPGATAGYRAWLGRFPDHHLSIALLCNAGNADAVTLAHKVADIFLPTQVPAQRTTIRLTTKELARRAGLYVDLRMGLPLRLEVQGDALKVSSGPVLVAASVDEFIASSTTFRFSGSDRLTRETADGDVREFRLTQPWQPISSKLIRYAGQYTSDEALATYQVTVKGSLLVLAPEDRCGEELILHPIFSDTFEFLSDEVGGVLHFSVDSKGKVSSFEMSDSRVHALRFSRTAAHGTACAPMSPGT